LVEDLESKCIPTELIKDIEEGQIRAYQSEERQKARVQELHVDSEGLGVRTIHLGQREHGKSRSRNWIP
jgi:hypothetical protein